ncbi:hypothetical protein P7K49_029314 [Saguinus oedipus]|uniref:Uncharacterized protein n=1 Tax=Saguinus oedipus TaxID=9490 RepID=A0ABQ9U7Q9_SAGOE|nr:hypothetical protein P7K49_029314 [Saguinus oedipus]
MHPLPWHPQEPTLQACALSPGVASGMSWWESFPEIPSFRPVVKQATVLRGAPSWGIFSGASSEPSSGAMELCAAAAAAELGLDSQGLDS